VIDTSRLRKGMEVFGADGRPRGRIDAVEADAIRAGGRTYRLDALERVDGDRGEALAIRAAWRLSTHR
jgi:hypothetical protein